MQANGYRDSLLFACKAGSNRENRQAREQVRLTNKTIAVCFEAINEPGGAFLESMYHKLLALALQQTDLPSR